MFIFSHDFLGLEYCPWTKDEEKPGCLSAVIACLQHFLYGWGLMICPSSTLAWQLMWSLQALCRQPSCWAFMGAAFLFRREETIRQQDSWFLHSFCPFFYEVLWISDVVVVIIVVQSNGDSEVSYVVSAFWPIMDLGNCFRMLKKKLLWWEVRADFTKRCGFHLCLEG